jgi:hypothetical protein
MRRLAAVLMATALAAAAPMCPRNLRNCHPVKYRPPPWDLGFPAIRQMAVVVAAAVISSRRRARLWK